MDAPDDDQDTTLVWYGNDDETKAMIDAIENNAKCDPWCDDLPWTTASARCPTHRLLNSQRSLDGLLDVRRRWFGLDLRNRVIVTVPTT